MADPPNGHVTELLAALERGDESARDRLFVSGVEPASEFLGDLSEHRR